MAHGETSPSWAARSGADQTAEAVAVLGAGQAAAEHGDEDISAAYLIGAPENAA